MKKTSFIIPFICIFAINLLQSQEKKEPKFSAILSSNIGYAVIENDNEPSYNLNSSGVDFLINFKINQKFGVATGVGQNTLSGSGFNSLGNFYHRRSILKIPLLATLDYKIKNDNFKVIGSLGFYTQNIIKDESRFLNNSQENSYKGWNFGMHVGLGFAVKMHNHLSLGINFSAQSDLSKFKTNSNSGINDKQKLRELNSIGLFMILDL